MRDLTEAHELLRHIVGVYDTSRSYHGMIQVDINLARAIIQEYDVLANLAGMTKEKGDSHE